MKISDWKESAELVGITAIVASLVFVGLQLRQTQEIAIAGQYQERYATALEYWHVASQDEWYLHRFGQRELDRYSEIGAILPNATAEEIGRNLVLMRKVLLIYDNHHFQYHSGFMTAEAWNMQRDVLKTLVGNPFFYHLMQNHSHLFRPSYLELCYRLREES